MTILRTITYVWVGIELANCAYLYWYGYKEIKTTPIIKYLQLMFFFGAGLMFFLAFMPIILELETPTLKVFINLIILFLVPFGYATRMFRKESITKKNLNLPKK